MKDKSIRHRYHGCLVRSKHEQFINGKWGYQVGIVMDPPDKEKRWARSKPIQQTDSAWVEFMGGVGLPPVGKWVPSEQFEIISKP